MKNNISQYIESEVDTAAQINPTYLQPNNSQIELKNSFILAMCENKQYSYLYGQLTPKIKNLLLGFDNGRKEGLYITAIQNLYKKIDYLQLNMQFDQELIDEAEFNYELETYEDRYLIVADDNFSPNDFDLAVSIIHKIKTREFSTDEIAEMFSIPLEKVELLLQQYESKSQYPNF